MDIRAAEISKVIKDQIANFGTEATVTEVGSVLSVGDGIARVHGLSNVKASELVDTERNCICKSTLITDCSPCPFCVVHFASDSTDCCKTWSTQQVEYKE